MSVITISRQFGAGGKTIGEKVAQKKEYAFYDNELIQMAAEKAKVSKNSVEAIEKGSGQIRNFFSGIVPKSLRDLILDRKGEVVREEVYVDILSEIITEIADEGNAVIVGRAAQYILAGRKDVFNALIVAEKEDRIAFMEEYYELTRDQALRAVESDDKRRANLYRAFGKTDYDRPEAYHIVLNMSSISLETACELLCELVE